MKSLALIIMLASCTGSATIVDLSISYDDGWGLTELRLSGGDRSSTLAATHEMTLYLPDDWAGDEILISLMGMRGEEMWAQGQKQVQPVHRGTIAESIALAPLSCATSCIQDSKSCQPGGVATCARGADGCFGWVDPKPCDSGMRCTNGACEPGDPLVMPSNVAVIGELRSTGQTIDVPTGYIFDTSSDCFDGSALGKCTPIWQPGAPEICVCRADAFTIHDLELRGERALALLSWTSVTIQGAIVVNPGVGEGGAYSEDGSAGGSYGTAGGGTSAPTWGTAEIIPLRGGMRGMGGSHGGRGGGALQITADQMIRVEGSINVGGAGASIAGCIAGERRVGTGGGSGGSLLLEARRVDVVGGISANGGGGSAGALVYGDGSYQCLSTAAPGDGADGLLSSTMAAQGGAGYVSRCRECSGCSLKTKAYGGSGGSGSIRDGAGGVPGAGYNASSVVCTTGSNPTPYPGGGGGGAGRMRINTAGNPCGCTGILSPSPSYGIVTVQ